MEAYDLCAGIRETRADNREALNALNTIWEVEDPPDAGWSCYARTYLISFAAVLALGMLLTVCLVLSAGLNAFGDCIGIPPGENMLWKARTFFFPSWLSLSFRSAP